MTQTVEEVVKNFLDEIDILVKEYGDSPVESALSRLLGPEFDMAQPISTFDFGDATVDKVQALEEQVGASKNVVGRVAGWIKGIKPKGGKTPGPPKGAGTGTAVGAGAASSGITRGLAGGAALGLVGKSIDQEVDLADISTTDKLGITINRGSAPYLETLIGQTNVLIQQIIALLGQSQPTISKGLDAINLSIDDMIATKTGETPEDVQARQELNPNSTPPAKSKNKKQRKR